MPPPAPHPSIPCPIRCFAADGFFALQHEMPARRNKSGTFCAAPRRRCLHPDIALPFFSMTYHALAQSSQICRREQKPGTKGKSETRAASTLATRSPRISFRTTPATQGGELDWRCKRGPRGRNWPASAPAMTWGRQDKAEVIQAHGPRAQASGPCHLNPAASRHAGAPGQERGGTTEIGERAARGIATMRPAQALEPTGPAAGHAGRQFRKNKNPGKSHERVRQPPAAVPVAAP